MLIRFPSVQCLMGATVSATVNLDVSVAIEGPLAQRLEQRTHNPLVPGSNPGGPTSLFRIVSVP
jgi:hypothetical protein